MCSGCTMKALMAAARRHVQGERENDLRDPGDQQVQAEQGGRDQDRNARPYQHADAQDHRQHPGGQRPFPQVGLQPWRLADSHGRATPEPSATALARA